MPLIGAGAAVVDGRVRRPGWLEVSGTRIVAGGGGVPARPADLDFPDAVLVPGFVDMHVHGGAGVAYPDDAEQVAGFHRAHGTTSTLASLVSAAPTELIGAVRALAAATRRGVVDGIHLEGPWLSPRHCGAHDPRLLRDPDPAELDAVLAAADGTVRMVTLAPELPGALAAIERLAAAGIVVAVGHTDADYTRVRAAIEAGATVGTHVFNAMRGLHQREPGPALALLEDPRVTLELIADGVHVHPALLRHVVRVAGVDRVAFVTDATAAAGRGDGRFRLGRLDVDVVDGVARVAGTSTIAGSTATMAALFGSALELFGPDPDQAVSAAVALTSASPARALGLNAGGLRPGMRADLVVIDDSRRVAAVMRGGEWLPGYAAGGG